MWFLKVHPDSYSSFYSCFLCIDGMIYGIKHDKDSRDKWAQMFLFHFSQALPQRRYRTLCLNIYLRLLILRQNTHAADIINPTQPPDHWVQKSTKNRPSLHPPHSSNHCPSRVNPILRVPPGANPHNPRHQTRNNSVQWDIQQGRVFGPGVVNQCYYR